MTYAGNITPEQAWDRLATDEKAVLIDVRTQAEWAWVGISDLSSLQKDVFKVEWVYFPNSIPNADFVGDVEDLVPGLDTPILLLCRSGVRSRYAAEALTAAGFKECYNISGGFEGDKNDHAHRGTVNGWKVAGLPWKQG